MSFSGFYQILCENGHLSECDAIDFFSSLDSFQCPVCKGKLAHSNIVNQTNCCVGKENCPFSEEERISCNQIGIGYMVFEVIKPAAEETCKECGHTKIVKHTVYKIPEKGEK